MIQINGDLVFIDPSGQIRSQIGDLTLRADSTNLRDIIVGSGGSLRPDKDVAMDLGRPDLRWHKLWVGELYSPSGTIDQLFVVSLFSDTLVANVSVFAPAIQCNDLVVNTSADIGQLTCDDLIVNNGATVVGLLGVVDSINVDGNLQVGGFANFDDPITISDGAEVFGLLETQNIAPNDLVTGDYAIGTSALRYSRVHAASGLFNTIGPQVSGTYINVIGSLIPEKNALYSLGTDSLRWANIFAVSGAFSTRPTVNGSGVVLEGESSFSITGTSGILIRSVPSSGTVATLNIDHAPGSGDLLAWGGTNGTKLQWKPDWVFVKLTQTFTTSSNAAQNVTELSFAPSGNKTYEFYAYLLTRTATANTGPRPGLSWPTGGTDGIVRIAQTSAAATEVIQNGNINAAVLSPVGGLPNTTQSWPANIEGMFIAGANPTGRIQVQLASESNGTNVSIQAGSYLAYREI